MTRAQRAAQFDDGNPEWLIQLPQPSAKVINLLREMEAAFKNLFELLTTHGGSPRSGTIDFAARLQQALDESKPFFGTTTNRSKSTSARRTRAP